MSGLDVIIRGGTVVTASDESFAHSGVAMDDPRCR